MGQISSHSLTPSLDGNLDKRSPYKDDVPRSIESEHTLESVRNIEAVLRGLHCVTEEGCYVCVALIG